MGEILVAINPFKNIPGIYDETKSASYVHIGDRGSKPPHLFAVADCAFQDMVNSQPGAQANQVPTFIAYCFTLFRIVISLI